MRVNTVGNDPKLDRDGARAAGVDVMLVDRHGVLDPDEGAVPDLCDLPTRV